MSFSVFRDYVGATGTPRRDFFKLVFGQASGQVCVSYLTHGDRTMHKVWFEWPTKLEEMLKNIEAHCQQLVHAYFCPSLYDKPGKKNKENIRICTNVWADLDTCDPQLLLIRPSILVQTSPQRFQALWLLEDPVEPHVAEEISRRIAYYHADQGADKSGWDLSQLLRIPYTPNYKYGELSEAPLVTIIHAERSLFRPSDFDVYPTVRGIEFTKQSEPPQDTDESAQSIITRHLPMLGMDFERLFYETPQRDWSGALWNLIRICAESGLRPEETFIVTEAAACNKYRRDGRPETDLWHDVQKAYVKNIEHTKLIPTATSTIPELLSKEEELIVQDRETFIERYIKWASGLTDASVQYHQSGAFVILSALLAGNIKLPTSATTMIPNLWFMILGNTTITRKTTAMNLAMRLLYDVDDRALLATDGSIEGILVGMRDRPKQPSIFLRDEFTGLLEAIAHKDYMAGFAEQLTKLYDGEPLRRLLRKEVIDIKDPIFIMYVGGIKAKTQMMITEELVMGGFLPRFVIVTAEPDLTKVRPLGPPLPQDIEARELIKNELIDMHNHYVQETTVTSNGIAIGKTVKDFKAKLTPEAWQRYNQYEMLMTKTALDAGLDYLTPVYDRLAKSTLKAAVLIAASTQRSEQVVVELPDLLHAIYYARQWRAYASEIVNGIGKTYDERLMDKIYLSIRASSIGAARDEIMNLFMLDSKRADLIFKTMEQRKLIKLVDINGEKRYQTYD